MENHIWFQLQAGVQAWLAEQGMSEGRPRNLYQQFEQLLIFMETKDEAVALLEPHRLMIAVALILLVPKQDQPSPAQAQRPAWTELWAQLYTLSEALELAKSQNSLENYLDLVVAWGCGWRNGVDQFDTPPARWPKAVFALSDLIEGSINKTVDLLITTLGLSKAGPLAKENLHAFANLVTVELTQGHCSCGNHKIRCKKQKNGSRNCSRLCCRDEHQLQLWQPNECTFRAFLAQAVRGLAAETIKPGAFETSILYRILTKEIGLLNGQIAFWVCSHCNPELIASRKAIRVSNLVKDEQTNRPIGLYEGHICPDCEKSANPKEDYRLLRKNIRLFIPYPDNAGERAYHSREYWRCPNCKNVYDHHRKQCPLCYQPRPRGTTRGWELS